ncbi:LOW QUALITY PROTEIN: angiotensinogen-like, partial [Antrostomus carolinensis]|uniref:LOW QUALITY PROTEIN: angiotensinogen-like n=1 Tax=Antrostomus carolinensis TaxID=279965 RepID=UPI0010A9945A
MGIDTGSQLPLLTEVAGDGPERGKTEAGFEEKLGQWRGGGREGPAYARAGIKGGAESLVEIRKSGAKGVHEPLRCRAGLRADTVEVIFNMNLTAVLLCLLMCLTTVTCDRVYVHPFNLFSFNKSTCEELESLVQEGKKTFVPISIESQTPPAYEDDLNEKDKVETPGLSVHGRQKLSYLKDFVHVLGMRFYSELREARQGQNLLLSPTSLYGSLVSFYLGASNQTAADLQGLLGFVPPSGDPDCTSRVDGHKVLSSLRTIESLIK